MPNYQYHCETCNTDFEITHGMHDKLEYHGECGQRVQRVYTMPYIASDALPNKRQRVRDIDATEGRWDKDMKSYKSLRGQGIQPKQIDGCADLERDAKTKMEIEWGRTLPGTEKEIKEGVQQAAEIRHEMGKILPKGVAPV